MFRVPYRWLPRTFFKNIYSCWQDIHIGVMNIIRWTPVIWHDADFDWEFLNQILIYKFERMAKVLSNGYAIGGARSAKHLRICAELCKRMGRDDYAENAKKRWPVYGREWAKHSMAMAKQDQELLGKIIGKYYQHWWD